jgi:hypothetical protein
MGFGIDHQICSAVPGQHASRINAVPHQHATLDLFAQAGAAQHPALNKPSVPLMKNNSGGGAGYMSLTSVFF